MKAMILAAGFGTRLFPLTIDRTKPAIPFMGKPLVGYVAEYIARFGIKDIIVNLHHRPESVVEALGDGSLFGVNIEYSREADILGTAGALDNARGLIDDDTFVIVNGKIITDIDLLAALDTHKRSGAIATMVLKPNTRRERFTVVEEQEGLVTNFGAMPAEGQIHDPLMFTGIHILEPRVFDYIPRGVYSDIVPAFYEPALKKGEKVAAHLTDALWFELSTLPRYLDISLAMMNGSGVQVGQNCSISDRSKISDSVIWENVTVGDGATLYRTIVADGVTIEAGEQFENAVIVRADRVRNCKEIPEKAPPGFFKNEKYIVPLN